MTAPAVARTTDDVNTILMAEDPRPAPSRDRWGRYIIPHPHTGKKTSWTRATTWASSVADTFGLTKWQLRMVALGLTQRPDLAALAATKTIDDKADLDRICEQAKEHAGASTRANQGTAMHSFVERINLGGTPDEVPDPYRADVDAYVAAMAAAQVTMLPDYVERIVTVPELTVAGTFDGIARGPSGKLRVADLKTGRDLAYSWTEIAIQLALYAHAETIFDVATGEHLPMPEVEQDLGLVMHLPVGEARCDLYLVDIAAGWEMAQVCGVVREWRKRKNLATLVAPPSTAGGVSPHPPAQDDTAAALAVSSESPPTAAAPIPVETPEPASPGPAAVGAPTDDDARRAAALFAKHEWIVRERITPLDQRGRDLLAAHWPPGVPTMQPGNPHTFDELTLIAQACDTVDAILGQPFPEHTDPTDPRVIAATADDIAAAVARLQRLPHDLAAHVAANVRGQVPKLTNPHARVYQSHLDALEPHLAAAETEAAPRLQRLSDLIGIAAENGVTEADLLAVVGRTDPLACTAADVAVLDMVTDACALGVVTFDDLDGFGHQSLVVDRGLPGKPSQILAAGRAAAKTLGVDAPRSAADVLAAPLLAAVAALRDDAA